MSGSTPPCISHLPAAGEAARLAAEGGPNPSWAGKPVGEHGAGEYVRGIVHTNSIESFWALLKRGHYGNYHQMSPKHLQRYVDLFATRCNLNGVSFDGITSHTVMAMVGKRLTYGALIHGA